MKVEIRYEIDIDDVNVVTKEIQLDQETLSFTRFFELVKQARLKLVQESEDDINQYVVEP